MAALGQSFATFIKTDQGCAERLNTTVIAWPNADVSSKLMAAAEFVYLPFSNQTIATLWHHLAFKGYPRKKRRKYRFK